jgi:hypothetical protein
MKRKGNREERDREGREKIPFLKKTLDERTAQKKRNDKG